MARRRRGHDDRERRTWQDPAVILSPIGLKEGMVFVDVGCGEGFFSIPAARMVGKTGKVIGIDADEQAITYLIRQAEYLDLPNLTAWRGRAKEKVAVVNGADVVFFGICLHDF